MKMKEFTLGTWKTKPCIEVKVKLEEPSGTLRVLLAKAASRQKHFVIKFYPGEQMVRGFELLDGEKPPESLQRENVMRFFQDPDEVDVCFSRAKPAVREMMGLEIDDQRFPIKQDVVYEAIIEFKKMLDEMQYILMR